MNIFKHLTLLLAACVVVPLGAWAQALSPTITAGLTTTTPVVGNGIAFPTTYYHQLTWTVSGTISSCSVSVDISPDTINWVTGGAVPSRTCTIAGQSTIFNVAANYVRINVSTLTGGGTLNVTYTGYDVVATTGPSLGAIGPVFNVKGAPYNAAGTGSCVTDAVTNSTTTVTSASANFTAAMVGWMAWAFSTSGNGYCNTNGVQASSTLRCGSTTVASGTTIAQVNSSSSITLSSACTSSATGVSLVFCPNDYTPFSAASTAITNANGGRMYIPAGFYCIDNSAVGTTPPFNFPSTITGSTAIEGEGEESVQLFTPPWYNHGNNFGSVIAAGTSSERARNYLSKFTIDLQGLNLPQGPDTIIDIFNPAVDSITVSGANLTSGSTESIYVAQGNADTGYINNSTFRPVYNAGIAISGPFRLSLVNDFVQNLTGSGTQGALEFSSNSGNSDTTIIGGFYISGGSSAPAINLNTGGGSGIRVKIFGASVCSSGPAIYLNRSDATLTLDSVKINDDLGSGSNGPCVNRVGTNATALEVGSGTAFVAKSLFVGNGTGNTINNAGTVVDGCGNMLSGGAGYTGSGLLEGQCGSSGIANQTGALQRNQTTMQTAATAATTIYAVPSSGVGIYTVHYTLTEDQAATTSSTLGPFNLICTDNDSGNVVTVPGPSSTANTTGTAISGVLTCNAKASTNIQISVSYTSGGATPMGYVFHSWLDQ